jgi:hypothetical protein
LIERIMVVEPDRFRCDERMISDDLVVLGVKLTCLAFTLVEVSSVDSAMPISIRRRADR